MTRVIADETLNDRLKSSAEPLEICDQSGRILGVFQPALHPDELREIYDWAKAEFARSEAELEEARQDPVMYTTQEVLEYLRSL